MNKREKSQRMLHIDGLKGILCFLIMLGHFWNIYRFGKNAEIMKCNLFEMIRGTFFEEYFLRATFWLYAFLVISGFLLSRTRINSFGELLEKSFKRFLRFLLPMTGACLLIFIIQETIGFHANETTELFKNNWFQKYYVTKFTWKEALLDSFNTILRGEWKVNNPYWVIKDMFTASIVMYLCNFIDCKVAGFGNKKCKRNVKRMHIAWIALGISIWLEYPVFTACMIGYLLGYYDKEIGKISKVMQVVCVPGVIVILAISREFIDSLLYFTLIHAFLFILINKSTLLKNIFSSKVFVTMGRISFGVFSFHWPVICSAGSIILIQGFLRQWRPESVFFMSLGVSVIVTVVLSVIYYNIIEKNADRLIGKITFTKIFQKLFK